MPDSTHSPRWFYMPLLLLALLCCGWWWQQSRPSTYPDAPAGEFACLSYTPRSDSTRQQADIHAQIERDLAQLAQRTHCVRTYAVSNGLDYVPTAARKHGMKVMLGAWIGSNAEANASELQRLIDTATANRDVVTTLVVGNEVLLRREQSATALYDMLVQVKAATQMPVTYADVWDFWLKNPQLAEVSDVVAIHILPYWDDQPIAIEHAIAHVESIFNKVQQAFPNKPVIVGETGWPSAGRQRQGAEPSLHNQARFTREFIAFATQHHIPYNFIEAYDQPWKKRLEGTVGGYWGLYDAQGVAKFPLTGAVIADAQWYRGWLWAGLGALLAGAVCVMKKRPLTIAAWSEAALLGASLGSLLPLQYSYMQQSCRTLSEWLAMSGLLLLTQTLGWSALLRLRNALSNTLLWILMLLALSYINLGLTFDARYRDFPIMFVAVPMVLALRSSGLLHSSWRGAQQVLSAWLMLSSLSIVWLETLRNTQALYWCAACLVIGLCFVRGTLNAAHAPDAAPTTPH